MVEAIQICLIIGRQAVCVAELRLEGPVVRALSPYSATNMVALDK